MKMMIEMTKYQKVLNLVKILDFDKELRNNLILR